MPTVNLDLLVAVAGHLRPLLNDIVFVGGCTTELLVTDPAAPSIRPTTDVDAMVEIASYAEYDHFSERLRKLGFHEDARPGAPRCRWLIDDKQLDVMPTDERILGFSNPWYKPAIASSQNTELAPDLRIRVINGRYFVATKIVAFRGRERTITE